MTSTTTLPVQHAWFQTLVESLCHSGLRSPWGDPLPAFPPEQLQRNTTGLAGEAALRQAFHFYADVLAAAEKAGIVLGESGAVLDFGVGWGRIARFFLRDVPRERLFGIDVDPEFVALSRSLFDSPNFATCTPFPPTSLAPQSFDVVSAYSVFSHLSERACLDWMREFARVLRPGGIVAFTTRHETFFDYCEWAATQHQSSEGYLRALGSLFPDVAVARRRYRSGEFVHATSAGVSGGGPRTEAFYGESFIPEAYVRTRFPRELELISHGFDGTRYDQAFFALRKRG